MVDEREPEANKDRDQQSDQVKPAERVNENRASEARSDSGNSNKQKIRKDSLEDLSELIVERATSAHPTLKAVLAGSVELFVKDRPFRTLFDFTAVPPKRLATGAKECDCLIETDERTIMRIHQGELNPQLAMVSDKMAIKGKSGLAVYFFNLLGD